MISSHLRRELFVVFMFLSICRNESHKIKTATVPYSDIPGLPGLSLGSLAVSPCQLGAHVVMSTSNIITGMSLCRVSPCKANLGDKKHLTNQD